MPLGRAPIRSIIFHPSLPSIVTCLVAKYKWGEKWASVEVAGGMFLVVFTFHFYTISKHDFYDLREGGVGLTSCLSMCGREGLEEIKNFERRRTDLEAIAIVQIRSKESLNPPVTARMNCKNPDLKLLFKSLVIHCS